MSIPLLPAMLSLSPLKSGTVPVCTSARERTGAACRWEALRDMTIAAFRVPRDILGNPVPRCCLPAYAEVRRRFGRLIIFLHPLWTDYVRQAWQAAQITAYFFLYPFVLSFLRARRAGNDAMRLCAMVAICTTRPSASLPLSSVLTARRPL